MQDNKVYPSAHLFHIFFFKKYAIFSKKLKSFFLYTSEYSAQVNMKEFKSTQLSYYILSK